MEEWLEHARKETAEVTEKLRKKYKKARDRGWKEMRTTLEDSSSFGSLLAKTSYIGKKKHVIE